MEHYQNYVNKTHQALVHMIVTDRSQKAMETEEGLQKWCTFTAQLRNNNATMFFIGNGASAAMASHMAADAAKNGGFRSMAFNDSALMSAVSNDISYEQVFAVPLQRFASTGDILVTISSSGKSPNIVAAIQAAQNIGLKIITLSGMQPDNTSRQLGDINFFIPAMTYGLVEVSHQVILHCWLDTFMDYYSIDKAVHKK